VQTECGHPESDTTSGLVAYLDGEPVGWCAVEPRTVYPGCCQHSRALGGPSEGQDERHRLGGDLCLHPRRVRRRGISYALARAAVAFARRRGARALEAYPMITEPGKVITWDELHVASRSIFAVAGLTEAVIRLSAGS
jgi:hypothetical protein